MSFRSIEAVIAPGTMAVKLRVIVDVERRSVMIKKESRDNDVISQNSRTTRSERR